MQTLLSHRPPLTSALESARLTKKDWDKVAQILEGQEGDRNGIEYLFTEGKLKTHWYGAETRYYDETHAGYSEWDEFEDETPIRKMDVDEEQVLWILDDCKNEDPEFADDSRNEIRNLFIEAI